MKKSGYSATFSASVTAVASTIGGIIPPSIPIVLFASVTNKSVGKLFSAGILPGILVGFMFMAVCYVISERHHRTAVEHPWRGAKFLAHLEFGDNAVGRRLDDLQSQQVRERVAPQIARFEIIVRHD
jgi:TRAP-type C4-dicarboxylate transport system permease large subunit